MKSIVVFLILLMVAGVAYADPRMEANANICHWILDADNTDNEIFMAGCDSQIIVYDEGETKTAIGYAAVTKWIPTELARALLKDGAIRFTAANDPCTMVDSNNDKYTSDVFDSRISSKMLHSKWARRFNKVKVEYELFCGKIPADEPEVVEEVPATE